MYLVVHNKKIISETCKLQYIQGTCASIVVKGTQEWEFFGSDFELYYYFIVSYAEILRFCTKFSLIGHYWGSCDYSA
jgi:hypothetical protein